ncbi:MAG: SGNH/GDSL hydrolase family protein [Deltaproteobacteria bacterium]|nr:SGNH/GDSL hydrolase family protein [Deltaproteobacteria bacterium]
MTRKKLAFALVPVLVVLAPVAWYASGEIAARGGERPTPESTPAKAVAAEDDESEALNFGPLFGAVTRDGEAVSAEKYWAEFLGLKQRWEPYAYWRREAFAGSYINIDERGYRRTWNPTPPPGDARTIWCLGGSAMWGTGARDDFTIASWISKILDGKGVAAHVENLGESGWVSTQELIALQRRLAADERPDVVIFYDGVNDAYSAAQQGVAGLPQNEFNRVAEFNRVSRGHALQPTQHAERIEDVDTLARHVVDIYRANHRMASALAREYGFEARFVWQPVIFTKDPLSAVEQEYARKKSAKFAQKMTEAVYALAASELPNDLPNFYDFSDIFDGEPGTIYIDFMHITETGNQRIARAMVERLGLAGR